MAGRRDRRRVRRWVEGANDRPPEKCLPAAILPSERHSDIQKGQNILACIGPRITSTL